MIREYLGAVSTAATRKLPKGDRLLFVGRTRAAIEAQVGPLASADDADAVAAALTALGDPDELADKERERLYSARRRGAAAEPPTLWRPPGKTSRRDTPPAKSPRGGSAGTPPRRSRTWPYRRSGADDPARPSPAGPTGAEPEISGSGAPGSGAPGSGGSGSGAPGSGPPAAASGSGVYIPAPRQPEQPGPIVGPGMAGRTGWSAPPGTVGPGVPPGTAGSAGTAGANGHNGTVGPGALNGTAPSAQNGTAPIAQNGTAPSGQNFTAPGIQGSPAAEPGSAAEPGPDAGDDTSGHVLPPEAAPADGTKPLSIVPGMETPGPASDEPARRKFGPPAPLIEAWTLARQNKLEAVAVLLLGVGGLIYPFPLWLIGGLVALRSRHWDKRDKWLALVGPVGFAAICMVLLGISGSGGFFHALAQSTHQFSLLLRVGCVLCAGYLVWRLRRGPRRRKTPPWLRGR